VLARYLFHRLRQWDRQTANNVDLFLANSHHVRQRIWRTYRRPARVLYPPVRTARFQLQTTRDDHYVTVSRLVSYKRVDLIVEAFRNLPNKKLLVIGDGPELPRLRANCPPNVELMGFQSDEVVQRTVGSARAFVFAAHEDFGISPVEAQACGTPVIAYGVGGATETVRDLRSQPQPTGLLFPQQTPASLVEAIEAFEASSSRIDPHDCHAWAQRFGEERFTEAFSAIVAQAWDVWQRNPREVEARLIEP
jgi:glycosyltransferase involved in cell wall biosynthesis